MQKITLYSKVNLYKWKNNIQKRRKKRKQCSQGHCEGAFHLAEPPVPMTSSCMDVWVVA